MEDNSELRRGTPVAHTIYGVPQTINTANYVYFQAVQELLQLQLHPTSESTDGPASNGKGAGADGLDAKGKGKEKARDGGDLIGLVTGEHQSADDVHKRPMGSASAVDGR